MANTLLRDKARILRSKGASLNEITNRLNVPKATARYWCRDIVLSKTQQKHLFERQKLGGILAAEKIRTKRIILTKKLLTEGINDVGRLSKREVMLIGTALYWAEGYRKGDGKFGFTNSDPKMIKFIINWLTQACGVEKKIIHLRVCTNMIHKDRIKEMERFWSKVTKISPDQFDRPTFINFNNRKTYFNQEKYFGTLRVKVRKSTNLRRRIIGWIAGVVKH